MVFIPFLIIRWRRSKVGQGRFRGGWSSSRKRFRSTIPRRKNYVSLFWRWMKVNEYLNVLATEVNHG